MASIKVTQKSKWLGPGAERDAKLAPFASLRPDSEMNQKRAAAGLEKKTAGGTTNGMGADGRQKGASPIASLPSSESPQQPGQNPSTEAAAADSPEKPPARTGADVQGEIYKKVDESTDTVYGQLGKYLDTSNPIMQRVAQQAKDAAGARGLTSSSIAVGNAQGAMVDRAGEFATTDAGFYNNRKTENQRAATHLASTRMNNQTQLESVRMQNQNQRYIQKLQDAAAYKRARLDVNSRESVAEMEIEARALDAEMDRASRERIASLNAENQFEIEQYAQSAQDERQQTEAYSNIWRDYNSAVMNIDINASSGSQRQQLERINDAYRLRLEAQGFLERAAGIGSGQAETGGGTVPIQDIRM